MKKSLTLLQSIGKIAFLFVFMCISLFAYTQNKKVNKDERLAITYFNKLQYAKALPYYKNAWLSTKKKSIARKIIICHKELSEFNHSLKWFSKLGEINSLSTPDQLLYSEVLQSLGKYQEIQSSFETNNSTDLKISTFLQSADSSLKWLKQPNYVITSCGSINTKFSENSPVIYQDGLVFASNREGIIQKKKYGLDNHAFLDFYFAKGVNQEFKHPSLFSSKINSNGHEGAISFNIDYSQAYFTRSEATQRENNQESDRNRLKIYLSEKTTLGWSDPYQFAFNDSSYSFLHPHISSDEKYFFFSCDLPDGYGGSDIYYCTKLSNGKWSKPKNLGPSINTSGNEMYPTYDVDNSTLTFSSSGHIGMGGYDLFISKLDDDSWGNAENLKSPINSSYNDLSISWLSFKKNGYLCSNRPKGKGDYDIYFFTKK